ncbi:MAG: hypothetical protein H6581_23115 [Bacteroidia bacterium]|nr:hypothetical protein [Bacteroidia bacterium]
MKARFLFLVLGLLVFLIGCEKILKEVSTQNQEVTPAGPMFTQNAAPTAFIPVAELTGDKPEMISSAASYSGIIQKYYDPSFPERFEVNVEKVRVETPGENMNYYAEGQYFLSAYGYDQILSRNIFMRMALTVKGDQLFLRNLDKEAKIDSYFKEIHWCESSSDCATCGEFKTKEGIFTGCQECSDGKFCGHKFEVFGIAHLATN